MKSQAAYTDDVEHVYRDHSFLFFENSVWIFKESS